jgi:hypothetical protein
LIGRVDDRIVIIVKEWAGEKANLAAGLPSTTDQEKETCMPNPGRQVQVIDQAQLEDKTESMVISLNTYTFTFSDASASMDRLAFNSIGRDSGI